MGALRVGSLALSLRLPDGVQERAGAVRQTVERRFLPAVLDALARELDAAYGDAAVIRIRKLAIRLRIGPEVRNAADLARQVGQDLAAHVRDIAQVAWPRAAPADAEVRVWPTAGAWHAAALVAALRGEPGPEGWVDALPAVAERLLGEPPDVVATTLAHCAEAGVLTEVVAALPATLHRTLLARFATTLPPAIRSAVVAARASASAWNAPPVPEASPTEDRHQQEPPTGSTDAGQPLRKVARQPEEDVERLSSEPARASGDARPERPAAASTPSPRSARAAGAAVPDTPATRAGKRTDDPMPARRTCETPGKGASRPPDRHAVEAQASLAACPTRWGGLVYLVTLALRLGMPEALWRIGVPEGAALSAMLAAISGASDDPVSAALAPGFPDRPAPLGPVPGWARSEFCATVAAAAGDLAGTDLGARIEARHAAFAEDGAWRLAEWGAALLLATLEEMIDWPPGAGAPTDRLAIAGEVEIAPDLIRVRLPLDAIDLDIRRAGLDANPGLLLWLDKRLVIEFGPGEQDWAG